MALSSDFFIEGLVDYPSPSDSVPTLNLLMFGVMGAGKSSFINSVVTSLHSEMLLIAPVGGQDDQFTKELKQFLLSEIKAVKNCQIAIWDTWGVDDTNYQCDFLLKLLSGEIPNGFKMEKVHVTPGNTPSVEQKEEKGERMHGVFLFVPLGILEDQEKTNRVKEILKHTNYMGMTATLIVTRADTVADADKFKRDIALKFNLPLFRVNTVSNYVEEREKDFKIDKRTLWIFSEGVKRAQTYYDYYCRPPSVSRSPSRDEKLKAPIPLVYLCQTGSSKENAEAKVRNVDGSCSVAAFRTRIMDELNETFAQVTFVGSRSESDAVSSLIKNEVLTIAFPAAKESKVVVMRDQQPVGVLHRVELATKLVDLRKRINAELEISTFTFLDEGIQVFPQQEKGTLVSDLIKEGKIFIR